MAVLDRQPAHPRRRARRAARMGFAAAALLGALLAGCRAPLLPAAPSPSPPPPPSEKSGLGLPGGWVSTPRLFAAGVQTLSVAATPSRLLATTIGPAPSKLVALSESGDVVPFAARFVAPPEAACYLEVAPGVGTFVQGDLFVGCGSLLWQLSQTGDVATVLATLPIEDGPITGLCFDTAGAFAHDLLALTESGTVRRIDATGRLLHVGSVGPGARGPSIASMRFGRHGGQLLVALPQASEVHALDASGNVTLVLRWSGVSGTWAVPEDPRAYGSTDGALFLTTEAGEVWRYPLRDLSGRGGEVLLTSLHRSGSGIVTPEPGGFRTRSFSRFVGAEVAAGFVRRPSVMPVVLDILPGAAVKTIQLGSTALLPVGLLATTGFVPQILDGGDVRLAGAAPVQRARGRIGTSTDLNGDGVLDLLLQFRPAEMMLLPLGDATLVLEGTALAGDRVRGAGRVLVLAP